MDELTDDGDTTPTEEEITGMLANVFNLAGDYPMAKDFIGDAITAINSGS